MHADYGFDPSVEHDAIRRRREHWQARKPGEEALPAEHPAALAFSGGGIRSATFSLGLAQALAEKKLFPHIDYLATVSGGGYTGSFLGSLFLPRLSDFTVPDPVVLPDRPVQVPEETALQAAERAERILTDDPHEASTRVHVNDQTDNASIFHPILWLRENGRYLTPSGASDLLYMAAFYLRALFGTYYVLALALLGGVILVYIVRMGLHVTGLSIGGSAAVALEGLDWDLGVAKGTLLWASPILWLAPVFALVVGGPLILAYWLVFRQEKKALNTEEWTIKLGPWWMLFAAAIFIVLLVRFDKWANPVVALLGYAAYLAVCVLLMQRLVIPRWMGPNENWTMTSVVARVRLKLTQGLTTVLKIVLVILAAGVVDSLGQSLFVFLVRAHGPEYAALGTGGGLIGVLLVLARKFGSLAVTNVAKWRKTIVRMQTTVALVAALVAMTAIASLLVALVQWVVWSPVVSDWASHGKAEATLKPIHWALVIGLIVAWLLMAQLVRESLGFLNNSSFHRFYSARLVRTFLGAANFRRLLAFQQALSDPLAESGTRALFVSESHPDDDVSLRSYYGGTSAGPLHLVCSTLNESLSETSNLTREDRKGTTLTVGPLGLNVGAHFYPWAQPVENIGSRVAIPGLAAPLENATSREREAHDRLVSCERLPLGAWAAISGAAVSTGLGHMSSVGFSTLAWLVNARLGYWWICAEKMSTQRRESGWKTFDLVQQEMSGGFYGQRGLRWSLSDGGHFENTAVYELLRRRAALIVCSDNGADPEYRFNDIQNLVRRARIDFGAEIEFLDRAGLDAFISQLGEAHAAAGALFGTMEEFRDSAARDDSTARGNKCALAARVCYACEHVEGDTPAADEKLAREGLLILVKPSVTQFAPLDVKLYATTKPQFPQQPTGDQFFDEGQWESYRKLGLEIGLRVFAAWDGYVKVARKMAAGG